MGFGPAAMLIARGKCYYWKMSLISDPLSREETGFLCGRVPWLYSHAILGEHPQSLFREDHGGKSPIPPPQPSYSWSPWWVRSSLSPSDSNSIGCHVVSIHLGTMLHRALSLVPLKWRGSLQTKHPGGDRALAVTTLGDPCSPKLPRKGLPCRVSQSLLALPAQGRPIAWSFQED